NWPSHSHRLPPDTFVPVAASGTTSGSGRTSHVRPSTDSATLMRRMSSVRFCMYVIANRYPDDGSGCSTTRAYEVSVVPAPPSALVTATPESSNVTPSDDVAHRVVEFSPWKYSSTSSVASSHRTSGDDTCDTWS